MKLRVEKRTRLERAIDKRRVLVRRDVELTLTKCALGEHRPDVSHLRQIDIHKLDTRMLLARDVFAFPIRTGNEGISCRCFDAVFTLGHEPARVRIGRNV